MEEVFKVFFVCVFDFGLEDQMGVVCYDVWDDKGYYIIYWWNINCLVVEDGVVCYILYIVEDVIVEVVVNDMRCVFELLQNGFMVFMDLFVIVQVLCGVDYIVEFVNEVLRKVWLYVLNLIGKFIFEICLEYDSGEL